MRGECDREGDRWTEMGTENTEVREGEMEEIQRKARPGVMDFV